MMRPRNVLPLVVVALLGTAPSAEASFMLRFSTAGDANFGTPIADNGPGDTNPLAGAIAVNVGPLTVTATATNFISPALSLLDLQVGGMAVPGSYNLVVQASMDGINIAPAPQTLTYDFTSSSVFPPGSGFVETMRTWVDD